MKILLVFAVATCAWAQINHPNVGKMLDANGAVRTVYGIAASVTLGDPEITSVLSQACSKNFCLAKTGTSILSPSGTVDAPAGPALFAFTGEAAFVWFPQSRQLAQWQNGVLTSIDSTVDGEVLSLRASGGSVVLAVRRQSGEWLVNPDGSVADSLPRSSGPLMLIPDGAVYATRNEIVIRDQRIPLDRVTAFSQMAPGYLQVRAAGIDYALRIEKGREMLFQLPGVNQ
jgi:hypothetical protein